MNVRGSVWDEPEEPCPYCGAMCEADFVNIGVGMQQCGPYHCEECGASEIGPEGKTGCTEEEIKTGWYRAKVSPYANTVAGTIIDHKTAKRLYDLGLLDEKVL
jgi:hypothetical protein